MHDRPEITKWLDRFLSRRLLTWFAFKSNLCICFSWRIEFSCAEVAAGTHTNKTRPNAEQWDKFFFQRFPPASSSICIELIDDRKSSNLGKQKKRMHGNAMAFGSSRIWQTCVRGMRWEECKKQMLAQMYLLLLAESTEFSLFRPSVFVAPARIWFLFDSVSNNRTWNRVATGKIGVRNPVQQIPYRRFSFASLCLCVWESKGWWRREGKHKVRIVRYTNAGR